MTSVILIHNHKENHFSGVNERNVIKKTTFRSFTNENGFARLLSPAYNKAPALCKNGGVCFKKGGCYAFTPQQKSLSQ